MSTASPQHASSLRRRAFLLSSAFATVFVALFSPLRSVALSQITHGLHGTMLCRRGAGESRIGRHGASRVRSGYWHTEGNQILTDRRAPVRISGVNWSGFETISGVAGGLQYQDYRTILRTIAAQGYTTVRIPLSNQVVEHPSIPSAIAFESDHGPINSDLEELDSLQVLDRIVDAAGELGLKVILDNHRSEAGSSAEANGLWYTDEYPEQAWIADWVTLARRYHGNSTVVGFDLRNEPHNAERGGACWDCGGEHDWHLAAERAGNAVLRANSSLLIFVEGVDQYGGEGYWWGGNLAGVRSAPVHLAVAGRLVYSPHVYGPSEYQQPWFNAATTPATLAARWHHNWSFISESGLAPIWIGEFGTPNDLTATQSSAAGSQGQWFGTLVGYLQQHPEMGWTYWGINGDDRYGLLGKDFSAESLHAETVRALDGIRAPLASAPQIAAGQRQETSPALASGLVLQPSTASQQPLFSAGQPSHAAPRNRSTARPTTIVPSCEAEQVQQATRRALASLAAGGQ